jgi:cytidyltransferase-like protein
MIVYTGGTFDLFHSGHVRFLQKCSEHGEVVVSVNTDDFVETYKERPICSLEERMETVAACKYVNRVMVNHGGADSKPAIIKAKADIIVVGSDWQNKDYFKQMDFTADWLLSLNISLLFVPYTEHISSTIIKARILDRVWQ